MKPITIHPLSILVGLLVLICFSAQSVTPIPSCDTPPLRVAGIPAPADMVLIKEEDGPFVVPPGKVFVLTGIGAVSSALTGNKAELRVDGQLYLEGPWAIPDAAPAPDHG